MIDNIKTPEDILDFFKKNITYGWVDINGEKHVKEMKDFRKLYRTSSINETLQTGLGTCIEQVNLMKYLFDIINVHCRMFCTRIYESNDFNDFEAEEHMHCFLLYYLNDKVYHLEHPNFEKIGIYEYDSEADAINNINDYYIKLSGGTARPVTEFFEVDEELSFKDFNNYINSLTKTKIC